jgi:hypothetical protein
LLSHVDFLASLTHLAGLTLTEAELSDSRQLAAVVLGRSRAGRDHLVTEGFGAQTLLRQDSWVYIPAYPGPALFGDKAMESGSASAPQLYDLSVDAGQQVNLADRHPDRVKTMRALLDEVRNRGAAIAR